MIGDVDVEMFLGRAFPRSEGRIEVCWRPHEGTDVQRVQWIDDAVSLGWHEDDDHPDLGTTHFQIEAGADTYHEAGQIEVETPVSFLESCLDRLPDRLDETVSG